MSRKINVAVIQARIPEICKPFSHDFNRDNIIRKAKDNLQRSIRLIEKAADAGADVVVASEDPGGVFMATLTDQRGKVFYNVVEEHAEFAISELSGIARERKIYIVCSIYVKEKRKIFNHGLLFNRNGKIDGIYRKVHVPAYESHYVAAGNEYPVFKTDFGVAGIMICYDLHFPEPARCLALQGADVVFVPISGFAVGGESIAEARIRCRCFDNGLFMAASTYARPNGEPGLSMIVDCKGEILANAGYAKDVFIKASISPDQPRSLPRYDSDSIISGIADWRIRNTVERRPETYGILCNKKPPFLRRNTKAKLWDIVKFEDYIKECAKRGHWDS
jgi:predicted amidohydrolase